LAKKTLKFLEKLKILKKKNFRIIQNYVILEETYVIIIFFLIMKVLVGRGGGKDN
jgi:hypothetical protein